MTITEQQFQDSVATLTAAIKEKFPEADLRLGSAVRDLALNPAAYGHVIALAAAEDMRASGDLRNDVLTDEVLVEGLLRNLGVDRRTQSASVGEVRIILDALADFAIPANYLLRSGGLVFTTTAEHTVAADTEIVADLYLAPYRDDALAPDQQLYAATIPVQAVTGGEAGNLEQGTALGVDFNLTPHTQWQEAATHFTGGGSSETVEESLDRAIRTMGRRAMDSAPAIGGLLEDHSDLVQSSEVVKGTDLEMSRNRHNIFAIGVGSHSDVYVKDFVAPTLILLSFTATKVVDGEYKVLAIDAPGWLQVATVTVHEPIEGAGTGNVLTVTRYAADLGAHTMDTSSPVDVYGSAYQRVNLELTSVAPVLVDAELVWPDEVQVYLSVYQSPTISLLQSFVDDEATTNVVADHLIRGPYLALTSVEISGRASTEGATLEELRAAVSGVIHGTDIGEVLPASSVTAALIEKGLSVSSIHLSCCVIDATGVKHALSGSELDADAFDDPYLSAKTVVFVTTPELITIVIRDARR